MATKKMNLLVEREITVEPIFRDRGGVYGINHDSNFLNEGSKETFQGLNIEMTSSGARKVDPFAAHGVSPWQKALSDDEKDYLAERMGLSSGADFNIYKKDGFWTRYSVKLDRNGLTLDLNKPEDFIIYRYLLSFKDKKIAPNKERSKDKGTYRYALVDAQHIADEGVKEQDYLFEAYDRFATVRNSKEKMYALLLVHYMENSSIKTRPNPDASEKQMSLKIGEIIKMDPGTFVKLYDDPDFATKELLYRALVKGVVRQNGSKFVFEEAGEIGTSVETIDWLKSPKNQAAKAKLINEVKG